MAAHTEHQLQILPRPAKGRAEEQHPPDHDKNQAVNVSKNSWQPLQFFLQEILLNDQNDPIIQAPCHKIPGRSMPQAREQPYDQQVADMLFHRHPVPSKRNI